MQVQGQSRSPWQKACPRIEVSATGDFIFFFSTAIDHSPSSHSLSIILRNERTRRRKTTRRKRRTRRSMIRKRRRWALWEDNSFFFLFLFIHIHSPCIYPISFLLSRKECTFRLQQKDGLDEQWERWRKVIFFFSSYSILKYAPCISPIYFLLSYELQMKGMNILFAAHEMNHRNGRG